MEKITATFSLHDDPSTREKLTVMTKWEAIIDDERNTELDDLGKAVEAQIQPGQRYRITIERIGRSQ